MRDETRRQIEEMRHELIQLPAKLQAADDYDVHEMLVSDARRRSRRQASAGRHQHHQVKAVQFQMSENDYREDPGQVIDFSDIEWAPSFPAGRSGIRYNCSDDTGCNSVTIKEPGLYFVYAQVLYENALTNSMLRVTVTSSQGARRVVLRCDVTLSYVDKTIQNGTRNARLQTCHSAALTTLVHNDVIALNNVNGGSTVKAVEGSNYWGLIKLTAHDQ